ncbi:hybrid sensor histidine kinase/response regulator [bacterium]|nr:hybrid sensor histidine kinase/response regulator [bacterium]
MTRDKATILIVEDEKLNIDILSNQLKGKYKLIIAKNGKQAIQRVENNPLDLILMDVMMPEMDGFETCKILKNNKDSKDIPIIFLTAKTETADIVKGFDLGGVDYITKPFNSAELQARISTHLELKQGREEIARKHAESNELLHILCHDLANPIGAAKGLLLIIKEEPALFDQFIDTGLEGLENSMNIINLVREIRELDEKGSNLELNTYGLKKLVDSAHSIIEQKFREKDININVNIPLEMNVLVERTSFINSVINNLLTNAIKFSFPNSMIEVSATQVGNRVRLSIKDFGIGMPEEISANIFDVTANTSQHGTSGEKGTGFGMPLVKKFVAVYGGEIEVKSKSRAQYPNEHGTEILIFLKA